MIATSGLASASSSKPAARSIALDGARAGPSTISRDGNALETIDQSCCFWDTIYISKHRPRPIDKAICHSRSSFSIAPSAALQHKMVQTGSQVGSENEDVFVNRNWQLIGNLSKATAVDCPILITFV